MSDTDRIFYAIGDIHGEYKKLRELHAAIDTFHTLEHSGRTRTIVHLGDYIDRGPDSRKVVDYLSRLEPSPARSVINLKGNHEAMLLASYADDIPAITSNWLRNGGEETLKSYDIKTVSDMPPAHIKWMDRLPTQFISQDGHLIFVHAGIDPAAYPNCRKEVHLWTRTAEFFETHLWRNPDLDDVCVIHGHTPTLNNRPYISPDKRRINMDTGACYGGALTAAVLLGGTLIETLSTK